MVTVAVVLVEALTRTPTRRIPMPSTVRYRTVDAVGALLG
jgi:hypothetical protein